MSYSHISTDNLHGDEPEIDALAAMAENILPIDEIIRDRKERYAALDESTVDVAAGIVDLSLRIVAICTDMARFPLSTTPDEVIEIEGHIAGLKTLARKMAK